MYLCAKNKVENSVKAFRLISSMEAISFLVLLGIAMPLKYIWDMPGMVQSIGWIHGLLFVLYIIGALVMYKKFKWSLSVLAIVMRSEEHTSELQSRPHLVCRLLLEKKNK